MTLAIHAIDPVGRPDFAGRVTDVDLTAPLTAAEVAAIAAGMDRFAVLVFRDQRLTDDQQVAFSARFGPLEQATGDLAQGAERRLGMTVNDISNLDRDNQVLERDDRRRLFGLGNRLWHSDSSFKPTPAKYSALSARVIPASGGNTEFADMRAAYDALDDATREEIADLVCEHSQLFSRALLGFDAFTDDERRRFAPVPQRLVRRHPVTGRRSLFLASHAGAIRGWPMPEARALLRDLIEHATQRRFVYAHVWRQWDLVMWDNRVTMHRARPFDSAAIRDMHRTTVADSAPTLEQAA
ncbi:MAG TPA: TauD/TfdA family dioxygenase [Acetobacteraceae bacterium]|nr:TauD/TfdA family dioxygenase [Acetobacteraceae bacterium]